MPAVIPNLCYSMFTNTA